MLLRFGLSAILHIMVERFSEASVRTGFRLAATGDSMIQDCSQAQHGFSHKSFTVLRVSNEFDIENYENIYIHQLNPNLDIMNSYAPLNIIC